MGVNADWDSELKRLFQSLKNEEGSKKQEGIIPLKEGKDELNFPLFVQLGKFFRYEGDEQNAFTNSWC